MARAWAAAVLSAAVLPRAGAIQHAGRSAESSSEAGKNNEYRLLYGGCTCDVRDLECLPSKQCLEAVMANSDELIAAGVQMRKELKQNYISKSPKTPQNELIGRIGFPMGKVVTYGAIENWMKWVAGAEMANGFQEGVYSQYIDTSRYSECQKEDMSGSRCFWKDFVSDEDLDELETEALKRAAEHRDPLAPLNMNATFDLEQFRAHLKQSVMGEPAEAREDDVLSSASANEYILSMAHISRVQFNMQKHLRDAYKRTVSVVNPGVGTLKVGVHIRRADSCSVLNNDGYMTEPSTIDTHAQMTNVRLCYQTSVYLKILRRIKQLYGQPLAVYLSSDDSGSIIDEMKELDAELFESSSWHYLNFARDEFKYANAIEAQDEQKSGFLGMTAILDTWHLSHIQMFVGSVGSRFGKAAYLLASARNNIPIPYVSVDGHSYCCENDEQCSKATSALTGVVDCITFAPEIFGWFPNMQNKYWEEGVTVRYDRPVEQRSLPWSRIMNFFKLTPSRASGWPIRPV